MGICKICGNECKTIPDWPNWECNKCYKEQLSGVCGTIHPSERKKHNDDQKDRSSVDEFYDAYDVFSDYHGLTRDDV